jgi:hypothetical protein
MQECEFIEQLSPYKFRIKEGFVPNMRVPGIVYVNEQLQGLLFDELRVAAERGEHGGFLPAVKQIANVAALPGIVSVRERKVVCKGLYAAVLVIPLMHLHAAALLH